MSLPHVILTVLSTRDATGYDITKEFSASIGYFWKASHQQVYRELNKMADKALVTCKLEPQEGKPDRKVYSITDAGRIALGEWFDQPTAHPTVRDEFSAKLMACSVQPSAPFKAQLAELKDIITAATTGVSFTGTSLFTYTHFPSRHWAILSIARLPKL